MLLIAMLGAVSVPQEHQSLFKASPLPSKPASTTKTHKSANAPLISPEPLAICQENNKKIVKEEVWEALFELRNDWNKKNQFIAGLLLILCCPPSKYTSLFGKINAKRKHSNSQDHSPSSSYHRVAIPHGFFSQKTAPKEPLEKSLCHPPPTQASGVMGMSRGGIVPRVNYNNISTESLNDILSNLNSDETQKGLLIRSGGGVSARSEEDEGLPSEKLKSQGTIEPKLQAGLESGGTPLPIPSEMIGENASHSQRETESAYFPKNPEQPSKQGLLQSGYSPRFYKSAVKYIQTQFEKFLKSIEMMNCEKKEEGKFGQESNAGEIAHSEFDESRPASSKPEHFGQASKSKGRKTNEEEHLDYKELGIIDIDDSGNGPEGEMEMDDFEKKIEEVLKSQSKRKQRRADRSLPSPYEKQKKIDLEEENNPQQQPDPNQKARSSSPISRDHRRKKSKRTIENQKATEEINELTEQRLHPTNASADEQVDEENAHLFQEGMAGGLETLEECLGANKLEQNEYELKEKEREATRNQREALNLNKMEPTNGEVEDLDELGSSKKRIKSVPPKTNFGFDEEDSCLFDTSMPPLIDGNKKRMLNPFIRHGEWQDQSREPPFDSEAKTPFLKGSGAQNSHTFSLNDPLKAGGKTREGNSHWGSGRSHLNRHVMSGDYGAYAQSSSNKEEADAFVHKDQEEVEQAFYSNGSPEKITTNKQRENQKEQKFFYKSYGTNKRLLLLSSSIISQSGKQGLNDHNSSTSSLNKASQQPQHCPVSTKQNAAVPHFNGRASGTLEEVQGEQRRHVQETSLKAQLTEKLKEKLSGKCTAQSLLSPNFKSKHNKSTEAVSTYNHGFGSPNPVTIYTAFAAKSKQNAVPRVSSHKEMVSSAETSTREALLKAANVNVNKSPTNIYLAKKEVKKNQGEIKKSPNFDRNKFISNLKGQFMNDSSQGSGILSNEKANQRNVNRLNDICNVLGFARYFVTNGFWASSLEEQEHFVIHPARNGGEVNAREKLKQAHGNSIIPISTPEKWQLHRVPR